MSVIWVQVRGEGRTGRAVIARVTSHLLEGQEGTKRDCQHRGDWQCKGEDAEGNGGKGGQQPGTQRWWSRRW